MKDIIVLHTYGKWHYYNLEDDHGGELTMKMAASKFGKESRIFTTQVSLFIKHYHEYNEVVQLPDLVDIESFTKQFLQTSNTLQSQKTWNLYKLLKEHGYIPNNFQLSDESLLDYANIIAKFLKEIREKSSNFEDRRFNEIEIPINKIIYERQRKGIAIGVSSAKESVRNLEETTYSLKNKLQLHHGIFEPLDIRVQKSWLTNNGIEINGSIERTFKNNQRNSTVCELFYELIRTQKDLNCFLDILGNRGGEHRVFPTFHGFGTITSRITLREPALQNLRKRNRKIINPDPGYEFLYVDYSQFEAGILASLSQDKTLCKLYDEDIYESIAKKLGDGYSREDGKIEFYKFMYGSKNANKHYRSFRKLQRYKRSIEDEAGTNKLIGTSLGNYRVIPDEVSISLSHKIQATASLIFKEAIIKASTQVHEAEFVLPMHDAVLYQINRKYDIEEIKNEVMEIFTEVFAKHCPGISPRVNDSSFYV